METRAQCRRVAVPKGSGVNLGLGRPCRPSMGAAPGAAALLAVVLPSGGDGLVRPARPARPSRKWRPAATPPLRFGPFGCARRLVAGLAVLLAAHPTPAGDHVGFEGGVWRLGMTSHSSPRAHDQRGKHAISGGKRSGVRTKGAPEGQAPNIHEQVTARIISQLEAGRIPWVQPWANARRQSDESAGGATCRRSPQVTHRCAPCSSPGCAEARAILHTGRAA